MNQTIETLLQRKSVRAFTNKEIEIEKKELILQSIQRAPTAGNMMLYSVLDITDQTIKECLARTCDNQPFIKDAKMVLVFLADYHRWIEKFKQAGCQDIPKLELSDLILSTNDAVIAAHSGCIAAQSMGIGSCYIGDIIENFEEVQQVLNLPPHVAPVSMLVLGYPTTQQENRKQPTRFPQDLFIFENTYQELTEQQLQEYYPDDRAKALFNRKYISSFAREMVRSCKEIYKNWNQ